MKGLVCYVIVFFWVWEGIVNRYCYGSHWNEEFLERYLKFHLQTVNVKSFKTKSVLKLFSVFFVKLSDKEFVLFDHKPKTTPQRYFKTGNKENLMFLRREFLL